MSTPIHRKPDQEEEGDPLPAEVLQVAERISLRTRVPVTEMRTFLEETIGRKEVDGLTYQTYNIRDLQSKMLRYGQKQHHVRRRKKSGILTSRERKRLFDIRNSRDLKYDTFLGLHSLWHQYMQVLVKGMKHPVDDIKILKADYHGAVLIVAAARNPDLVNLMGILVQETKNMIRIITQQDEVLSIPKIGSVFAFLVDGVMYKINGSYIAISPQARSKIKLKARRKGDDV